MHIQNKSSIGIFIFSSIILVICCGIGVQVIQAIIDCTVLQVAGKLLCIVAVIIVVSKIIVFLQWLIYVMMQPIDRNKKKLF